MSDDPRHRLGALGERLAVAHLERLGYEIVARNHRTRHGEIDIVACDDETLVFVEVKTRHGEGLGRAEDAIGGAQAKRLLTAAEWFLAEHPEHGDAVWRVDLVAITLDQRDGRVRRLTHVENAVTTG